MTGFGGLQRRLTDVTRAMLSSTLKKLEGEGVVHGREFMDGKVKRSEYTLTEKAKTFIPFSTPHEVGLETLSKEQK